MDQVQIIDGDTVLSVDLVLEAPHEFPGAVTRFPVETGDFISDHIRNDPIKVSLRCFVTNTPAGDANPTAVADTYAALRALRAARRPVTIISDLERFPSMALENLSIPRDAENGYLPRPAGQGVEVAGGAMTFTADFVQVTLVSTQTARVAAGAGSTAKPRKGKTAAQAKPKTDMGRQSVIPLTADQVNSVVRGRGLLYPGLVQGRGPLLPQGPASLDGG